VKANQDNIQKLVNTGQLEKALAELKTMKDDFAWKNAFELRLLRVLKKQAEAKTLATRILKEGSNQELSNDVLRYIALIFSETGQLKQALELYKPLVDSWSEEKTRAEILTEYGSALANNNEFDLAELQFSESANLKPSNANVHSQLGRLYSRTGRVEKGIASYQRAAFLQPSKAEHVQRLAYWSNYSDKHDQQSNFHLATLWAQKAHPDHLQGSNTWRDANPDKPLKIGFISADFCAHAVSFFITPLLKHLNRDDFRIYSYSDVAQPDDITKEIQSYCDVWHNAFQQSDELLSAQIGADQLDILFDLSGHSANNRLGIFAENNAPIQISWLGYPSTTGLKSINYRITDQFADPYSDANEEQKVNASSHFSEELIRMENCFLTFSPYEDSPDVKALSPQSKKPIRFGSFNNLAKISNSTIDAWANVLHTVPDSTLYIKRQQLKSEAAKNHLIQAFELRGIDQERLILKTSKAKIKDHLKEYNSVDIALDTFPYNGTTTTFEALWMGTPVVTLSGTTHASRVSASILKNLGQGQLVANNAEEFVEIASSLASDRNKLSKLSKSLRDMLENSTLLDHQAFADEFGSIVRQKWAYWCRIRNLEQGIINNNLMGASDSVEAVS